MQEFLVWGSRVALLASVVFLFFATIKAFKLNAVYAYVFFVSSMLVLALYLFLWHIEFGRVTQESQTTAGLATVNAGLGQWGQILLGGIGAAILTLLGSEGISRWKRPRLESDFKDEPTFLRENTDTGWESFWLRVRTTNLGRSVAKGCTGRITKFMTDQGLPIDHDPLTLHWIEIFWNVDPFEAVDLRRREERYLDVLVQKASDPTKIFLFRPVQSLDQLREVPVGTCRIEIVVYGENADPCPKEYRIMTNGHPIKWDKDHIKWDDGTSYKTISLEEFRH